jgi:lipoprotein NlpI
MGVDEARKRLLPISGDPRVPMAEIYDLFRGVGAAEAVLDAAESGDPDLRRTQLFYAHLYLGLYYEALGDEASAARHIRTAAEDYSIGHYMWHVARVHAERLNAGRDR